MAPTELAELITKRSEIALPTSREPHERGELATLLRSAPAGGQAADPPLEPPVLALERERPGVAVGQRPLEACRVVQTVGNGEESGDFAQERVFLRHSAEYRTPPGSASWAASPILKFGKT